MNAKRKMKPQSDYTPVPLQPPAWQVQGYLDGTIWRHSLPVLPTPETLLPDFQALDPDEQASIILDEYVWPYGAEGRRLFVREAWQSEPDRDSEVSSRLKRDRSLITYQLDGERLGRKRDAYNMPAWASRIHLTVTSLIVRRIQDTPAIDCIGEGIALNGRDQITADDLKGEVLFKYAAQFDRMHGAGLWEENPWCFVYTFARSDT